MPVLQTRPRVARARLDAQPTAQGLLMSLTVCAEKAWKQRTTANDACVRLATSGINRALVAAHATLVCTEMGWTRRAVRRDLRARPLSTWLPLQKRHAYVSAIQTKFNKETCVFANLAPRFPV